MVSRPISAVSIVPHCYGHPGLAGRRAQIHGSSCSHRSANRLWLINAVGDRAGSFSVLSSLVGCGWSSRASVEPGVKLLSVRDPGVDCRAAACAK